MYGLAISNSAVAQWSTSARAERNGRQQSLTFGGEGLPE